MEFENNSSKACDCNRKAFHKCFMFMAGPIIIAAAILYGAFMISSTIKDIGNVNISGGSEVSQNDSNNNDQNGVDTSLITQEGDPFVGNENAKLVIYYWFDYQCPFCKKFDLDTLPKIISDYVDKGRAKIVFKDFQFLGDDSVSAALVGNAIWNLYPDRYVVWHEKMFQNQDEENGGFGDMSSIIGLIKKEIPEIDTAAVENYINENRENILAEIEQDRAEGFQVGVRGTPSFVIGNQFLSGAVPYNVFQTTIAKQLEK